MIALTLTDGKPDLCTEYPDPTPGPGEVVVRMRLAGICGTDLALAQGYKGGFSGVPGHEYVGEVVAAPGQETWLGRRVVGEINTSCGQCQRCLRGDTTHCIQRRVLGILNWDGVFAEKFVSPAANLYPVPDDMPDEVAVFTEPVAAAYAALRDVPAAVGERVVVFGDGRLGQLIACVFKAEGYAPLLVGRHPAKLEIAAGFGIATTLTPEVESEYDIAIDATGRPDTLPTILKCLRPRGVLILKSTAARPALLDLSPIVVDEIRVIGSRCGPFPQALAALAAGKIDPLPLITATYPLWEADEAFSHAARPDALKVLVRS